MRLLHIVLINHCISERCIYLLMSQNFLYLFNRHTFLNCSGAIVLLNLCGCTFSTPNFFPISRNRNSTPLSVSLRAHSFLKEYIVEKSAHQQGVLLKIVCASHITPINKHKIRPHPCLKFYS